MRPSSEARLKALSLYMKNSGADAKFSSATITVDRDPHEAGNKSVELEWLGERSFTKEPYVAYKLALTGQAGGFTAHQAAVIRAANRLRIGRFPRVTRRLGPESGLTRMYTWGSKTKSYTCMVDYGDAERILAGPSGYEFRVVGEEAPTDDRLILPDSHMKLVNAEEYKTVEAYVLDERPGRDVRPSQ